MKSRKASRYILSDPRNTIRETIKENNGGEVFFIGKVDPDLMIAEVEPHAFGGQNAVPVLMRLVDYGDMVIHNHPDGNLQPSDADISCAAALGDLGVGSVIVDNECENIHVIVGPFREEGLTLLDIPEIRNFFSPQGLLSRNLSGYEHRPQQASMAESVSRAFNEDAIAIIEAGTGTGKSLAYLIPSIKWAVQNKERIVVSTNTINLQQQLVNKDLPLLKERLGFEFRCELMKGRGNYLCFRRLEYNRKNVIILEEPKDLEALDIIFDWSSKTQDGSLSDLNVKPSRELWRRINCEPETCIRTRCEFYEKCFFYQARRRAARADVLVVNHHLLMSDLSLRKKTRNYTASVVLPPFRRVIFDEAHNLESVATSYFTIRNTRRGVLYNLGRLCSKQKGPRKRKNRGLLYDISEKLFQMASNEKNSAKLEKLVDVARNEMIPFVHETAAMADEEYSSLTGKFLGFMHSIERDFEQNVKIRITPEVENTEFWEDEIGGMVERMLSGLQRLISRLKIFVDDLAGLKEKQIEKIGNIVVEVNAVRERIDSLAANLNFFFHTSEGFCRWVEYESSRRGKTETISLCIAPIDIREEMRSAVYDISRTIVMTSATLTVQNNFHFILDRLGLEYDAKLSPAEKRDANAPPPAPDRVRPLQLGTPFDYEKQAFVGIPSDFPEPNDSAYSMQLGAIVPEIVKIAGGGAFVLFTSYRLLNSIYNQTLSQINNLGYSCLKQGDGPRHRILEKFVRDKSSVLFATSSFWEGVDVKGEPLRCLILTRLPFRVPTEPLLQARAEALREQGRDPFRELDLPSAVIKFRQGFGRLIRSSADIGAVIILDRRVISKYYGRVFLSSLPTKSIMRKPRGEILENMKNFFNRAR